MDYLDSIEEPLDELDDYNLISYSNDFISKLKLITNKNELYNYLLQTPYHHLRRNIVF